MKPPSSPLTALLALLLSALPVPAFTDADWVSFGNDFPNGTVYSIVRDQKGNVYIGGGFTTIGNTPATNIAKWNGHSWSALGTGLNGRVNALAVMGTNVFAAGDFTSAGGVEASLIAKWDGSNWSPLGAGISGAYYNPLNQYSYPPIALALAATGTNLYVGGLFTNAGETSANCIAKWDGMSWSNLGSGMGGGTSPFDPVGHVYALAASGTNLYAGGYFSTAGELTASRIAKWDGSTWSTLGSGVDADGYPSMSLLVSDLAISGTNLYASGSFWSIGGTSARSIARWDGSTWYALDSGISGDVSSLCVMGTNLYVGGEFRYASGVSANRIAKWDGLTWEPLGSGFDGYPHAMITDGGGHLIVGGAFVSAGNHSFTNIAQANVGLGIPTSGRFDNLNNSLLGFTFTFRDGNPGQHYRIQTCSSLLGNWTDLTNFIYTAPLTVITQTSTTNLLYRAVSP